jgi:hypothetical protein
MLPLPENDLDDPATLAGWVELSVLAQDEGQVSFGDVIEELHDSNLVQGSSDGVDGEPDRPAEQLAADVWSVLEERDGLLGSASPFVLERRLIKRQKLKNTLDKVPAYLTMLLLEASGCEW